MSNSTKQDISSGNYRAVLTIPADGMANPERPNAETGAGGVALLDMVNLVDQVGNAIGVTGNPLQVAASFGGDVEVAAVAHLQQQNFVENSINPLQSDLGGNLKVTMPLPLPAGTNLIGDVNIASMPPVTAVTTAVANASIQSFANGTSNPLQADTQGNLRVIVAGGSSNAAAGLTEAPVPADGSYTAFRDANGDLKGVSENTPFPITGNVASTQAGSWNINLNAGTNAIGSITNTQFAIAGSLPTGANTIGAISNTEFGLNSSIPSGSNVIGGITNTGFAINGPIPTGANAIGSITNTAFEIAGSLPAGTNSLGKVSIEGVLPAGSNIIGKTGIDQSIPGTTNLVAAGQTGDWNVGINAGSNVIGSILNTGFNLTSAIPSGANNIGVTGVAQGSGSLGAYGNLVQGAVTTDVPTYTAGQVSPLSLDTSGLLRVNVVAGGGGGGGGSANAIANASTQSFAPDTSNYLQADLTGALKVNVVAGGGSGANIGLVGVTAPTSASYIAYSDSGGLLTGASTSNPFPVSVISGGGATTATANAATQSFADGTNNNLQADTTGALKVNVIATVGGGGGGGGSSNAIASAATQSFVDGSSNILQSDLTGGLKVVGTAANAAVTAGNPILMGGTNGTNTYSMAVNAAGQPLMATRSAQTQVNLTVTAASAYAAGNCVGGKLTFANMLGAQLSGTLQSITIVSKTLQTAGFKLYLFSTNQTNTTFTDKTAPLINALDLPYLVDVFSINAYDSGLGAMTIYPYDNVGKTIVASTTSLYAVLVTTGTPTFATTSNLFVTLTVLQD